MDYSPNFKARPDSLNYTMGYLKGSIYNLILGEENIQDQISDIFSFCTMVAEVAISRLLFGGHSWGHRSHCSLQVRRDLTVSEEQIFLV